MMEQFPTPTPNRKMMEGITPVPQSLKAQRVIDNALKIAKELDLIIVNLDLIPQLDEYVEDFKKAGIPIITHGNEMFMDLSNIRGHARDEKNVHSSDAELEQESHKVAPPRGQIQKTALNKSRATESETETRSFVLKELSLKSIEAIKSIPPLRKEIFDSNYVPQATLKLFEEAGFIAEPFFDNGKQYLWIRDGHSSEGGILHSKAVNLLREIAKTQVEDVKQKERITPEEGIVEEIRALEAHLAQSDESKENNLIETSPELVQKEEETVLTDEEFLNKTRSTPRKENSDNPSPDSVPTLTEEVENTSPPAQAAYSNLIDRLKTKLGGAEDIKAEDIKNAFRGTQQSGKIPENVPTLPLNSVVEEKSYTKVPPIVIKALQAKYDAVRVLQNGDIELIHKKGDKNEKEESKVEVVSAREALRRASSKVNAKLASYPTNAASLTDPMIESSLAEAREETRDKLRLVSLRQNQEELSIVSVNKEIQNKENFDYDENGNEKVVDSNVLRLNHSEEIFSPIEGETAERLKRKSKVLGALNEDVEDAREVVQGGEKSMPLTLEDIPTPPDVFQEVEDLAPVSTGEAHAEEIPPRSSKELRSPKKRMTHEESLAYIAEQKALHEIVQPETTVEKKVKPHLNNAESIAYLKGVKEMRERERKVKQQDVPPVEFKELPVLTDEVQIGEFKEGGESSVYPSSIDIELPLTGSIETADISPKISRKNALDIELPLERNIITEPLQNSPRLKVAEKLIEKSSSSPTRSPAAIRSDIAFLEKVKSEVSSGSSEFIEFAKKRDPEFKKAYESAGDERDSLVYMWIERKLQSLKSEKEGRKKPEQTKAFDERFTTEFGITKEALEDIEGFEKLSFEQQKLVFENLSEYRRAGTGGYLNTVWSSILKNAEKTERSTASGKSQNGRGGMEKYEPVLTQLVQSAVLFGPKMHEDNEGNLIPDLVHIEFDRKERGTQYEAVRELNIVAHELAKIPREWLEEGVGTDLEGESRVLSFFKNSFSAERKKRNIYETVQRKYARAQSKVEQALRASGKSDGEIAQILIELNGRVHQLQFIQTAPESVGAIQKTENKSVWDNVSKGMLSKSNLGYMTLGFVGRTATVGFLGFAAAPTVGASIAGMRAWNRTAAELRERDRAARMGVTKGKSAEALNIVQAVEMIKIGREERDRGMIQKTQDLISQFNKLKNTEGASESDRIKVLDKLKTRVIYIQDKIRLNRVNFGKKEDAVANMVHLYETLGEAQMIVADNYENTKGTPTRASKVEARLEEFLGRAEEKITRRRRSLQIKETAYHALRGGAFAFAGAALADQFRDSNVIEKIKEWWTTYDEGKAVTQEAIQEGSKETGSPTQTVRTLDQQSLMTTSMVPLPSTELLPMNESLRAEEKISSLDTTPHAAPIPTVQAEAVSANFESPTGAERAEIQNLFAVNGEVLPNPTALDIQGGRILETYFLSKNVPMSTWTQVRDLPIKTFVIEVVERGTLAERTPALVQLGKIFREMEKPPYGVKMYPNEKTEIYMHRVFTAITQANNRGLTTDTLRNLLGSVPSISRK